MKILLISAQAIETPPKNYGGLEAVVYNHARGLSELGENVTLIGARGSSAPPNVELYAFENPGLFAQSEEKAFWFYREILRDYDVILDHSWYKWSLLMGEGLPVISTMHSPVPFPQKPPKKFPMLCGVSAEHSKHASLALGAPVRTTWNSVDMSRYPFTHTTGDTFLSVNRIDPDKGIHVFVDWISKAGLKGDIIGEEKMVKDPNYPANIRASCKINNVNFSGLVSHEEKQKKLQECKAVVLLPQAPNYYEVFGLAAVEANATGKPVICTPNCGLKDLIVDGVSGFHVDTYAQFKEAVAKLDTITPEACRKQAEKFSIETISPKYRDLIKHVDEGCRW